MHTAVLSRDDVPRALRAARSLVVPTRPLSTALPETCHRDDAPDVEGWTQNVDEALRLVKAEVLEKLVLARQTTFHLSHQMNPIALTAKLVKATHACYHFCFQLRPNLAFLGATPERLFKREGDQLLSEAVAGTRPRGQTVGQDQRLAYDLLTSDKDQLEHDIVRKGIRQKLHHLVDSLQVDGRASVLSLARKQHLFSEVEARLKPCVSDGDLIERLHPTPAVGGHPTENALGEIARLEPFNRGWYAAPVGWVSADAAEFAVAIRSGLLRGHRLDLYSGAGIVPGSTAADEWDEIENKISDFIDIMRE
jgi:menaquinone-specific isochorismate synthase